MKDYDIRVNVLAEIVWREPPKDTAQELIRRQQNIKLQAAAHELSEEVEKMVISRAARS